ncbi:MAG: hypothetical protein ACEY3L_01510 [Wolbachia sp.]
MRLEILVLGSIIGGGVEHILDMEISEFISWVRQAKRLEYSWWKSNTGKAWPATWNKPLCCVR